MEFGRPLEIAAVVALHAAILLLPALALRFQYLGELTPDRHPEQARTQWRARWLIGLPAAGLVVGLTAVWLESFSLALLVAVLVWLLGWQAGNAARSLPALTAAYPVIVVPLVGWATTMVVTALPPAEAGEAMTWFYLVIIGVLLPPWAVAVVSSGLAMVIVAAKRRWFGRRLGTGWLRSRGGWRVADVRNRAGGMVLWFVDSATTTPPLSGRPPQFWVLLRQDLRGARLTTETPQPYRLSQFDGPGPTEVAIDSDVIGRRSATASLTGEVAVVVTETAPGGDEFFGFIRSLALIGRRRAADGVGRAD